MTAEGLEIAPAPAPVIPTWVAHALGETGITEQPGAANNSRITMYHAATEGPPDVADAIPWCSSFVNWCFERAGMKGTRSKAARSWMQWGYGTSEPAIGCITVLWRISITGRKGHVGIYLGQDRTHIYLLGGNQRNAVNVERYPKGRVLGHRVPIGYGLTDTPRREFSSEPTRPMRRIRSGN